MRLKVRKDTKSHQARRLAIDGITVTVRDGACIGVLEVLDRHTTSSSEPGRDLDDIELLSPLAIRL